MNGPTYSLVGTIGQPDASSQLLGPSYVLSGGFWDSPLSHCPADLAPPFGMLDFDDILVFLTAFGSQGAAADLAPPFGVLDFDDIIAFLTSFGAGCP